MGLYKRVNKDGPATWCIQYFADGKRFREAIGPSKREAEQVLGKRRAAIREGKFFDVRKKSTIAFGVLCDRFLKEHVALHMKPRSHQRYIAAAKVLRAFFGEDKPARHIKPEDVHRFVVARIAAKKSRYTVNMEQAFLSHMFTWATKNGLVSHHPVKGEKYLRVEPKERYLSHQEIHDLLNACTGDLRDMVVLALGTGMRASEVIGLDRDHVDLKNGVAILLDTKNHDRRLVPLPPEVVEMLARRPTPLREFFPGVTLNKLVLRFRRVVRNLDLEGVSFSFHSLRHTFASHAVMSGVDLYTLAKILGHRDIKMVQRYAHLAHDHLRAATNQAAKAIFTAPAADVPHEVPQVANSVA